MKKLLILLLSFAVFTGCAGDKPDENIESGQNEVSSVPSDVGTMAEPADALIRCMLENDVKYDPSDEMFFWKAVYYFAGMYAPMHGLSEVAEDGSMTLPRQTVQEFATVLFADYDDLLPLPEEMSENVVYSEENDAYTFYVGDRGLSETVITDFADNGDGTFSMTAQLSGVEENDLICEGKFIITVNEYADGISRPIYFYSVVSAEIN